MVLLPACSRHHRLPWVSLLAALLLTACATPTASPPTPAATPMATWSEPAAARDPAALARWWALFDDPLLGDLVQQALQANTDIRLARTSLAQARALRTVTAAALQPQVDAGASAGRSRSGATRGNRLQAGLDASWELDVFGANTQATRGADADIQTAQADLAATQVAIAGEVGQAYVQLRGYRQQLAYAQASLQAQLETLQITQWRAQAGLVSSLDAEQARATAEQTRASLPAITSNIAQTEHRLAVLLALPPTALRERLGTAERIPQVASQSLPLGLPAETLRARPDVQAAEFAIQAEAARLAQRNAQRLPSFAISGSLAVQAATAAALTGGASVISSVAAAVSWPLWDGGTARARRDAQAAVLEQSQVRYEATVLAALQDVEDALAAYRASQAQRQSLAQANEAAQSALLLARQRYQAGLVDFTVLLDAQRTALSVATSLAGARTNEGLALVLIYKGLGGGWQPAAAEPTPTPASQP